MLAGGSTKNPQTYMASGFLRGGGEGSRTPVRAPIGGSFSERSRRFRIPPTVRPAADSRLRKLHGTDPAAKLRPVRPPRYDARDPVVGPRGGRLRYAASATSLLAFVFKFPILAQLGTAARFSGLCDTRRNQFRPQSKRAKTKQNALLPGHNSIPRPPFHVKPQFARRRPCKNFAQRRAKILYRGARETKL